MHAAIASNLILLATSCFVMFATQLSETSTYSNGMKGSNEGQPFSPSEHDSNPTSYPAISEDIHTILHRTNGDDTTASLVLIPADNIIADIRRLVQILEWNTGQLYTSSPQSNPDSISEEVKVAFDWSAFAIWANLLLSFVQLLSSTAFGSSLRDKLSAPGAHQKNESANPGQMDRSPPKSSQNIGSKDCTQAVPAAIGDEQNLDQEDIWCRLSNETISEIAYQACLQELNRPARLPDSPDQLNAGQTSGYGFSPRDRLSSSYDRGIMKALEEFESAMEKDHTEKQIASIPEHPPTTEGHDWPDESENVGEFVEENKTREEPLSEESKIALRPKHPLRKPRKADRQQEGEKGKEQEHAPQAVKDDYETRDDSIEDQEQIFGDDLSHGACHDVMDTSSDYAANAKGTTFDVYPPFPEELFEDGDDGSDATEIDERHLREPADAHQHFVNTSDDSPKVNDSELEQLIDPPWPIDHPDTIKICKEFFEDRKVLARQLDDSALSSIEAAKDTLDK